MKIAEGWSFSTNRRPICCEPLPGGSVRPALFRAATVGGIALLPRFFAVFSVLGVSCAKRARSDLRDYLLLIFYLNCWSSLQSRYFSL